MKTRWKDVPLTHKVVSGVSIIVALSVVVLAILQIFGQDVVSSNGGAEFWTVFAGIATYIAIFAIVIGIALFILGSIVEVGYMKFNLDLVDRQKEAEISTMFGYFQFW